MHGSWSDFEYVVGERRRELLKEAEDRRLAGLARPRRDARGVIGRLAVVLAGLLGTARRPATGEGPVAGGEPPDSVYVSRESTEGPGLAVEVYLGSEGRVLRETDLKTGASSFVAGGR